MQPFLFLFANFFASISAIAGLFLFCAYFFPTLVAIIRGRHNTAAICLLNFFLGWTFIGWIVSLVWAVSSNPPPQQIVIHNSIPAGNNSAPVERNTSTAPAERRTTTAPTINPSHGPGQDKIQQLRQLKQLLDDCTLTQEEFHQQKTRILAGLA